MQVHQMDGEFVGPRDMVEIQQLGAEPNQIEACEVEWKPNYIVFGDKTFFLRTKLMAGNISWAVSVLGGAEKAKNMRATLTFLTDDSTVSDSVRWEIRSFVSMMIHFLCVQGAVWTWNGAITDLKTGFDDKNIFTMPSQRLLGEQLFSDFDYLFRVVKQLISYIESNLGLPHWTLRVQIGREAMEASGFSNNSHHKITSRSCEVPAKSSSLHSHAQRQSTYASAVICTACEIPIAGPRFKCTECPNYELCKSCCIEKTVHNQHIFLLATSTTPNATDRLNTAARNFRGKFTRPRLILLRNYSSCEG